MSRGNQGPTLALFHPSPFLIRAVDPLDVKGKATMKQVRARARQQIIQALPTSIAPKAPNARSNRRRKPAWAILAAIERAQKAPMAREFAAVQKIWGRVAPKDATLQTLLKQRQEADAITWLSRWELDALVDMALGAPARNQPSPTYPMLTQQKAMAQVSKSSPEGPLLSL